MVARSVALVFKALQIALKLTRTSGVVPHACGWQEAHITRPLGHEEAVAALATLVVFATEQGEIDREGDRLRVVRFDLVARGQHAHRRRGVATPAIGLVHDWFEKVDATHVGPIPGTRELRANLPLQEAGAMMSRLGLLKEHLLVRTSRLGRTTDSSVHVQLTHGASIPVWHLPRLPAQLQRGHFAVDHRDCLLLRHLIQSHVVHALLRLHKGGLLLDRLTN
mmetsp:Transcript_39178/g.104026  ORF Transcript_39178/g.104026 Transcript_39178/m.104026 type:complete len:222 (-) Transcript_39178:612-1277(-)